MAVGELTTVLEAPQAVIPMSKMALREASVVGRCRRRSIAPSFYRGPSRGNGAADRRAVELAEDDDRCRLLATEVAHNAWPRTPAKQASTNAPPIGATFGGRATVGLFDGSWCAPGSVATAEERSSEHEFEVCVFDDVTQNASVASWGCECD